MRVINYIIIVIVIIIIQADIVAGVGSASDSRMLEFVCYTNFAIIIIIIIGRSVASVCLFVCLSVCLSALSQENGLSYQHQTWY